MRASVIASRDVGLHPASELLMTQTERPSLLKVSHPCTLHSWPWGIAASWIEQDPRAIHFWTSLPGRASCGPPSLSLPALHVSPQIRSHWLWWRLYCHHILSRHHETPCCNSAMYLGTMYPRARAERRSSPPSLSPLPGQAWPRRCSCSSSGPFSLLGESATM